jgi:hypothetical protein
MKYSTSIVFRIIVLPALIAAATGCSTVNSDGSVHQAAPLLGTKELQLTSAFALKPEFIVLGVATYLIVDPLAPNWKIEQTEPVPGVFYLALKKKGITNEGGGDGEARVVFMRRAAALAREHKTAGAGTQDGYTILEFNEGIESEFPFARRVAHGVVQLASEKR